jgi:DNA-binding NarL/FixJ family response regulator
MSASISSSVVPLVGLRILVAAGDLAVLVLRAAALAGAGARVHAASTSRGALTELARHGPMDVAVLELGLPGGALALEAHLRTADPPSLSIVVGPPEPAHVRELLALGVAAHLAPPALPHALVPAVLRVAEATRRLRALDGTALAPARVDAGTGVDAAIQALARRRGLTTRERNVLRLIALGYRYEDIGSRLSIATRTVKMHADNLRRKTGTSSRRELLREVFGR